MMRPWPALLIRYAMLAPLPMTFLAWRHLQQQRLSHSISWNHEAAFAAQVALLTGFFLILAAEFMASVHRWAPRLLPASGLLDSPLLSIPLALLLPMAALVTAVLGLGCGSVRALFFVNGLLLAFDWMAATAMYLGRRITPREFFFP